MCLSVSPVPHKLDDYNGFYSSCNNTCQMLHYFFSSQQYKHVFGNYRLVSPGFSDFEKCSKRWGWRRKGLIARITSACNPGIPSSWKSMMMARRMLRGVPLAQSSSSSSLPLLSLPLVLSLRAFVAAHTSPESHPSSSPCQSSRCSASTTPFGSELSRWQSTIHSAPCTRQSALRHSSPMSRVPKTPGFTTDAAAPAADVTPDDVLRYWFKDADLANNKFPLKFWFFGGEAVDTEIQEKFGECLERATRGELDNWKSTPHGRVALVLVFDQFSRNCHRDSSRGFAQDEVALQIALDSIHQGVDQELQNPLERYFLYMPLMHSESLDVHKQAERVFQKLVDEQLENPERRAFFQDVVKFSKAHTAVLVKFGRYPSRNAVLGRTSTPEEEVYLARGELWSMED